MKITVWENGTELFTYEDIYSMFGTYVDMGTWVLKQLIAKKIFEGELTDWSRVYPQEAFMYYENGINLPNDIPNETQCQITYIMNALSRIISIDYHQD